MGKKLVIVESPTKARTIEKFLGSDYEVLASYGHVRDLPGNASEIPIALKKEKWTRIGINVDQNFEPLYIVPPEKEKRVKELQRAVKDADEILLATDEDREGESISWHLLDVLKPKVPVKRLVFHEITKSAIQESLRTPRDIDENLVRASGNPSNNRSPVWIYCQPITLEKSRAAPFGGSSAKRCHEAFG